jgi:hypothetical protein
VTAQILQCQYDEAQAVLRGVSPHAFACQRLRQHRPAGHPVRVDPAPMVQDDDPEQWQLGVTGVVRLLQLGEEEAATEDPDDGEYWVYPQRSPSPGFNTLFCPANRREYSRLFRGPSAFDQLQVELNKQSPGPRAHIHTHTPTHNTRTHVHTRAHAQSHRVPAHTYTPTPPQHTYIHVQRHSRTHRKKPTGTRTFVSVHSRPANYRGNLLPPLPFPPTPPTRHAHTGGCPPTPTPRVAAPDNSGRSPTLS